MPNTFNKNQTNNNDYSKIHLIIACENCKANFKNENELLYHYQICINQIINENNFMKISLLIPAAIKRDIPEPNPHLLTISSMNMTSSPPKNSSKTNNSLICNSADALAVAGGEIPPMKT